MANIGFTDKQIHVYNRFQKMRQAYQDAHGRTYAPDFLTVLMDAVDQELQPKRKSFGEKRRLRNERLSNQPVRIKDSDNRYISDVGIATANFDITSYKDESMIFDSHDEAKAFLRKYGRDVEDWILEPVNETI